MSNSYKVVLLLMLCIGSACNSPKENPLKGLPSGVWVPTTNTSSKKVGVKSLSGDGSTSYQVPFLITDNNPTTLNYYNSVAIETEFPVNKNKEGNWEATNYSFGTLLLESNPSKDTLVCFFEDEQGELEKIDYVLSIENPKTKIAADLLEKQLRGTTWSLSPELKIVFHASSNKVNKPSLFSHYVNLADSSDIKELGGNFYFQQNKGKSSINCVKIKK